LQAEQTRTIKGLPVNFCLLWLFQQRNSLFAAKPIFTEPIKMRKQKIVKSYGHDVRLKCKAKGKPRPRIQWLVSDHVYKTALELDWGSSHETCH